MASVHNGLGAVIRAGKIYLLARPGWKRLEQGDQDMWAAENCLHGYAELRGNEVRDIAADAEYAATLRSLVGCVAYRGGSRKVSYGEEPLRARWWEPYSGLCRRGGQSWRSLQRARRLDESVMLEFLAYLQRTFSLPSPEGLPSNPPLQ